MNIRDLKLRLRSLVRRHRVERELDEELAFHLDRETEKLIANGASRDRAHAHARARFGSMPLAAEECRDARGTAFIDNCVRDILYAFRTFRRAPLAALTIVTTVALGLGLVAVVFTMLNIALFRVDQVHKPGELFSVERPELPGGGGMPLTRAEFDALRRETDVFSDVFAMLGGIESRIDGQRLVGTLVTGNFFQVLGVNAAGGRPLTPADDQRHGTRPVIVLSHRGWTTRFGSDPAIIGRTILINGISYEIVGVTPEGFRGLNLGAPDYWAPLSYLSQFRQIDAGREQSVALTIVGRLRPGLSRDSALARLAVWNAQRTDARVVGRHSVNISLKPKTGVLPQPAEVLLVFTPLFIAFGLILMIGCANVANLLLARGVSRQREIGVRLSLGASRARIIRQLLTESLLLALASAALGFAISRVVLALAKYAATSTMAPEIAEGVRIGTIAADWRVVVFLVVGAVISTVFFGLAPALQATRVELVRAVRGEVTREAHPSRARNILVGVQVTASALLLICSAIFLRSALATSAPDPGVRTSDTLMIQIVNERFRDAMIRSVVAEPAVAAVAGSWPAPLGDHRTALLASRGEGVRPHATRTSTVAYKFVSPEYFSVLGIDVLKGRGFTREERAANAGVAIVSDAAARQLWPAGDPVGQVLHLEQDPDPAARQPDDVPLPARTFTVVGVVRDVAGFRFSDVNRPVDVYLPIDHAAAKTALTVRVHGDPEHARSALVQRLSAIDSTMGEVRTLRTMARMASYFLQIFFWLTFVLGGLALILTLSGLFSVLSYLVEQRRKEFSVRMALGATTQDVAAVVLSQSARPVAFGLLAGSALALGLAIVLMSSPVATELGGMVKVFDPVAYGGSLACIVATCVCAALIPALRAARIEPMKALRQE